MTLEGMAAFSLGGGTPLNSAEELEAALRQIGAVRYHNLHPFHRLLHGGKLKKGQVQAWALNRYYYQSTIPIKDAVVISRFRDRGIRLEWRHRIEDHDGDVGSEGGIDSEASRPVLPRHAKLKFDETRQVWVILAPERVLAPDEIAVEVLQLCDGVRSVEEMIDALAAKYTAERGAIATDVIAMLQDLADKGFLTEEREKTT
jgi:coenzyme PQQ biosynthesis protein PqqD